SHEGRREGRRGVFPIPRERRGLPSASRLRRWPGGGRASRRGAADHREAQGSRRGATRGDHQVSRILLMDGDVLAFRAAAVCEHTRIDVHGFAMPFATLPEGEAVLDNMIHYLKDGLGADSATIFLSDPAQNWRKEIDPNYKRGRDVEEGDRKGERRPLLLPY